MISFALWQASKSLSIPYRSLRHQVSQENRSGYSYRHYTRGFGGLSIQAINGMKLYVAYSNRPRIGDPDDFFAYVPQELNILDNFY